MVQRLTMYYFILVVISRLPALWIRSHQRNTDLAFPLELHSLCKEKLEHVIASHILVAIAHHAHVYLVGELAYCCLHAPERRLNSDALPGILLPHLHLVLFVVEVPAAKIIHF